ncbi:MAG: hypothetical protein H0X43_02825 [Nitrosospira sp.]|nr:hypothetical protein [Nitrosospira sp.]
MATFNATDLNTKPLFMGGYGNGAVVWGSVIPTAGVLGDVYRPVRIPAGMLVTHLDIVNDDLDTGGTSGSAKIGYAPVNTAEGPAGVDDYFSATSNFLTSAGRKVCAFHPIKFEKDVWVTITFTLSTTTFASGKVTAVAMGQAEGIK